MEDKKENLANKICVSQSSFSHLNKVFLTGYLSFSSFVSQSLRSGIKVVKQFSGKCLKVKFNYVARHGEFWKEFKNFVLLFCGLLLSNCFTFKVNF